jgi:hypothetical protein
VYKHNKETYDKCYEMYQKLSKGFNMSSFSFTGIDSYIQYLSIIKKQTISFFSHINNFKNMTLFNIEYMNFIRYLSESFLNNEVDPKELLDLMSIRSSDFSIKAICLKFCMKLTVGLGAKTYLVSFQTDFFC